MGCVILITSPFTFYIVKYNELIQRPSILMAARASHGPIRVTEGKHSLSVQTIKTKLTVVAVCFRAPVNACVLNRLKGGWHSCDNVPPRAEATFAAYALFMHVRNALTGTPNASFSSGISDVSCGVSDGHFTISWYSSHVLTHVRKALGLVFKALTPAKLFARYSVYCRAMGCRPVRAVFNHVAAQLIQGINAGVGCCVIGKLKVADKYAKTLAGKKNLVHTRVQVASAALQIALRKLNPGEATQPQEPSGASADERKSCVHSAPTIATSGWEAFVLAEYLAFSIPGSDPVIGDNGVSVGVPEAKLQRLRTKLRAKVQKTVKQKYGRLKDDLGAYMAFMALSRCKVSCTGARALCNVDLVKLTKTIKQLL